MGIRLLARFRIKRYLMSMQIRIVHLDDIWMREGPNYLNQSQPKKVAGAFSVFLALADARQHNRIRSHLMVLMPASENQPQNNSTPNLLISSKLTIKNLNRSKEVNKCLTRTARTPKNPTPKYLPLSVSKSNKQLKI